MGAPDDANLSRYHTQKPRFCLYCNTYYDDDMANKYHAFHPESCPARNHVRMGNHRLQRRGYLPEPHWMEILKYRSFLYKLFVICERLKLNEGRKMIFIQKLLKSERIPCCLLGKKCNIFGFLLVLPICLF